jgi:hypothetical protein
MSDRESIKIGRLLRAGTSGFVVGCQVSEITKPYFGALVNAPQEDGYSIYGLIHDIHIDDDGLVRQLVTVGEIEENVIQDNRTNRNMPLEISVLTVGYRTDDKVSHLIPPRPALSLDLVYLCTPEEIMEFTGAGRFGYFRHILRAAELPVGELLAAHLTQAGEVHFSRADEIWVNNAYRELITLLRDEYAVLMSVLSALGDIEPASVV